VGEMVDRDLEHLRLLKIGYYILAGIAGVGTFFTGIWMVAVGAMLAHIPMDTIPSADADLARRIMSLFVGGLGILISVGGVGMALLTFFTGRNLGQHRARIFCTVIGAITCLSVPWGTAIGVCTLIVLNRPSVKALFDGGPPPIPV